MYHNLSVRKLYNPEFALPGMKNDFIYTKAGVDVNRFFRFQTITITVLIKRIYVSYMINKKINNVEMYILILF